MSYYIFPQGIQKYSPRIVFINLFFTLFSLHTYHLFFSLFDFFTSTTVFVLFQKIFFHQKHVVDITVNFQNSLMTKNITTKLQNLSWN